MYSPTAFDSVFSRLLRPFVRVHFVLLGLLPALAAPLTLAQFAANPTPAKQSEADIRPLEPGKSIERELAGGQSHAYQITLAAGQYLKVEVEQRGIDAILALLGPDGKLITVEDEKEKTGKESLWAVAGVAGTYRLLVHTLDTDAKSGRYEAKLIEVRPATPKDRESQAVRNPRALSFGTPIERELAGSQNHAYRITLAARQYLNAAIEQRGIDVGIKLFSPDGKWLSSVDAGGERGRENLRWMAEADGEYWLAIVPITKDEDPGRYEVKLAELRVATDEDRDLAMADREVARLNRNDKYAEAIPLAEKIVAIEEKRFGAESLETAAALRLLANLHSNRGDIGKGDFARAESLRKRELEIKEKALGLEHTELTRTLRNLAFGMMLRGDNAAGEASFQRALAINEKNYGSDNVRIVPQLISLGVFYRSKADFARAESVDLRALAILEKKFGTEHPRLIPGLNELYQLYLTKADSAKAEPIIKRTLAIEEKQHEPDQRLIALLTNNLALIYFTNADYPKAEPLFQRAVVIIEKESGLESLLLINLLSNLALVYQAKFDFDRAEAVAQRALNIAEKIYGRENISLSILLNNLALVYFSKKDYAKAEPLFQRLLSLLEKTVGLEGLDATLPLSNLAAIYRAQGDLTRAEPLLRRALAIIEKAVSNHPQVAGLLIGLADLSLAKSDYTQTQALGKRALAIYEKTFGAEHIHVSSPLPILAEAARQQGDLPQAIALLARLNDLSESHIARTLSSGSEREKLTFLEGLSTQNGLTMALHTQSAKDNPDALRLALTTVLRRKGRGLEVMTDSISQLRRRAGAQDQALLDQYAAARAQLSALTLKGAGNVPPDAYRAQLKQLEAQVEKLETDISVRNDEFRVQTQPITVEAVQAAIPPDAALIEFFSYRPFSQKFIKLEDAQGPPRYVAYLLRREGQAQWVDLGEAKVIDDAVGKLREALRDKRRRDVKEKARAVDRLVMQPLRPLIGTTRRVFVSPDGALNLIPFAALVDERGQYLVNNFEFSYLSSGRDLLRLQVKQPNKQSAVVIANPDFGGTGDGKRGTTRLLKYVSSEAKTSKDGAVLSEYYFPPLSGTASEARTLKKLLPGVTMLTGANATEARLKQVSSPRVLHVATHGFFLEDQTAATGTDRLLRPISGNANAPIAIRIANPLLRSGLALAGANQLKSEGDDGILTAQEAAGLDLWGTKLVVLSACDTGVGEVKTGEGVYGLRRALVLAGSETQVTSLWPVSDAGTRDLMIGYYKRLLAGEGRTEALRQTQLAMLARASYSHPYYWASFIQSGEWANLEGKR